MRFIQKPLTVAIAAGATLMLGVSACGGNSPAPASGSGSPVVPLSAARTGVSAQRTALSANDTLIWQPLSSAANTAAAPPIMNAFLSLSGAAAGVPCFNCVGNPPIQYAYGIAWAQPYFPIGSLAQETYTFEDTSLTATCTIEFKIVQNKAVLATYKSTKISIGPGFFLYYHTSPLPSAVVAGAATVSGNVICPGVTTKPITENVYFH